MNYILYEVENHIATITLNRPKSLNAFSSEMAEEFLKTFQKIEFDNNIYCAIIKSNLPHTFTAGGDIKEERQMDADLAGKFAVLGKACVSAVETCRVPVIAAIHGHTLGAGFEIILGCDIVVSADDVQLAIPTINLGEIPCWGGTQRLARLIGKSSALDILLTGRTLSPQEALQMGIIQYITNKDELLDQAFALAQSIAAKTPCSVRCMKKAVLQGMHQSIADGFSLENDLFITTCTSVDRIEAMQAFLEKRPHLVYKNL